MADAGGNTGETMHRSSLHIKIGWGGVALALGILASAGPATGDARGAPAPQVGAAAAVVVIGEDDAAGGRAAEFILAGRFLCCVCGGRPRRERKFLESAHLLIRLTSQRRSEAKSQPPTTFECITLIYIQ